MPSVSWLTKGYPGASPIAGAFVISAGTTGLRFYSDAFMVNEIFPISAGIFYGFVDLAMAIDVASLRTGGITFPGDASLILTFASPVTIESVRFLGNPSMMSGLPPVGTWVSKAGEQKTVTRFYKVPNGELHIYDLSQTVNSVAVNFTVPQYPNISGDPALQCTGESAVGIPEMPMTYQWYQKQNGNWVALPGFTTLNMPAGSNFYGYWQTPPIAGEQFKLVAKQPIPLSFMGSPAFITGEKIWSINFYKLEANNIYLGGVDWQFCRR